MSTKPESSIIQGRFSGGKPSGRHLGAVIQARDGRQIIALSKVRLDLNSAQGRPLPPIVQRKMESFFATDFSNVRVHVGVQAPMLGALAFTTGADIYMAPGQYDPHSQAGQQLLGHELAHVVQQRRGLGQVPTNGLAIVYDDLLEASADYLGMRSAMHNAVMKPAKNILAWARPAPPMRRPPGAPPGKGAAVATRGAADGRRTPGSFPEQSHVIQRRIALNATAWLNGNQADLGNLRAYYYQFVSEEYARTMTFLTTMQRNDLLYLLIDDFDAYNEAKQTAITDNTPANWALAQNALDTLTANINAAIEATRASNSPVDRRRYSNQDATNWADVSTAILAARGAIDGALNTVAPQSNQMPQIPCIRFSAAQAAFPPRLCALFEDIYQAWQHSGFIDERSDAEIAGRTVTSTIAGSLRSWHSNSTGSLPTIAGGAPGNAAGLSAHYLATSGAGAGLQAAGPIGYAEYTGTGIRNDQHYSKIVLNYHTGAMYLTLSHYQLYDVAGVVVTLRSQAANSGQYSPWFNIRMDR